MQKKFGLGFLQRRMVREKRIFLHILASIAAMFFGIVVLVLIDFIWNDVIFGEPAYNVTPPINWTGFAVTVAFPVGVILFVIYSKTVQKTSKLGRKIRELGDYDEVVNMLNQQADEFAYKTTPYTNDEVVMLRDYCLIFRGTNPEIIPKERIHITAIPDPEYPNEILIVTLFYDNNCYSFSVYDTEFRNI